MKEPGLIADTLQQSQFSQSKTRPADVGIVSEFDKRSSSLVCVTQTGLQGSR
jgi:hypothetical protein